MKKIVIIGAGAMGSAFAVPCADNSNEVFLVGSFLEDKVIGEIKNLDNFHPILKSQLPKNIKVLKFSEFKDETRDNIDLLVIGVSSKGIEWIGNEISKFYKSSIDILLLTKGLTLIEDKFETLAEKLNNILKEQGVNNAKISAVGGPCLANGLVNRINSSVVLANEDINYDDLAKKSSEDVVSRLIQIKGIGKWTAQIYCLFSLGQPNIFPSGDLALQESIKIVFGLELRPSEQEVIEISENWHPWKSLAAHLLWAYYNKIKKKE